LFSFLLFNKAFVVGVFGCFLVKDYIINTIKRLFKIQISLNYGLFVGICKWFYELNILSATLKEIKSTYKVKSSNNGR